MQPKTAQIVCEGKCNPDRELLDAWIGNEVLEGAPKSQPFSGELLDRIARLRHTPHERVAGSAMTYRCTVCNTSRIY